MTISEYLIKTKKKRKIVGRGISAGQGKSCGRGQKGQKARKGGAKPKWFEGGQTPFFRRIPKHGPSRDKKIKFYFEIINLKELENDIKVKDGQTIDFDNRNVKILGNGTLTKRIIVKASAFAESAKKKIEQAGGSYQIRVN